MGYKSKKLFSLLLATILMLVQAPGSVLAQKSLAPTGSVGITSFEATPTEYKITAGDPLPLPSALNATDDTGNTHSVPVNWQPAAAPYDPTTSQAGTYTYTAVLADATAFKLDKVTLPQVNLVVQEKQVALAAGQVDIVSFDKLPSLDPNNIPLPSAYKITAGDPLPLPAALRGYDNKGTAYDVPVAWSPKLKAYDPASGTGGIFFYTSSLVNGTTFRLSGAKLPTAEVLVTASPTGLYEARVYVQTVRYSYSGPIFPYLGAAESTAENGSIWVRASIFDLLRYAENIGTLDDGPQPTLRHTQTGMEIECQAIFVNPPKSPADCLFLIPGNAPAGEWELTAHTIIVDPNTNQKIGSKNLTGRIRLYRAEDMLQVSDVTLEKTNPNDLSDRRFTFSCNFTNKGEVDLNLLAENLPVASPAIYAPGLFPVDPSLGPLPALQFTPQEIGDLAAGATVHLSKTVELPAAPPNEASLRFAQTGIVYGENFYSTGPSCVLPYASKAGYLTTDALGGADIYNRICSSMASDVADGKDYIQPDNCPIPADAPPNYDGSLNLSDMNLSGMDLGALRRFPKVRTLHLSRTGMTNADLANNVSNFMTVQSLLLDGNALTDIAPLSAMNNLKGLDVSDNGLQHVALAPKTIGRLKAFSFNNNPLQDLLFLNSVNWSDRELFIMGTGLNLSANAELPMQSTLLLPRGIPFELTAEGGTVTDGTLTWPMSSENLRYFTFRHWQGDAPKDREKAIDYAGKFTGVFLSGRAEVNLSAPSNPSSPSNPSAPPKTDDRPEVDLSKSPKTSDDANICLWIVLLTAAGICLTGSLICLRKKSRQ